MTDQKPDAGDNTPSTDNAETPPEPEEVESAAEQPEEAGTDAPVDEEVVSETADESV